jgi:hypothetical protein
MTHRLRFTTAGLVGVLLALGGPRTADAKRRPPPEVTPVVAGEIRYTVPHFGALHGKEQNGGYVQAWEVGSGKLLWDRMIYRVVYDAKLERDAQDVFIARISVEGGTLLVENDLGERFEMDLGKGAVKAVVKTSSRTEVAPPLVVQEPAGQTP